MVKQRLLKYGSDVFKDIDDEIDGKDINLIIESYYTEINGNTLERAYGFISVIDEKGNILKTKDGYKISFSVNVPELIMRLSKYLIKNENDFEKVE